MGCLKSIIKKIIFLALIVAFFALGGYAFVKQKINEYKNPIRDEFVKTEKNYGDFSGVSSDYQLSRNYNLFGYKKITAKYLPTNQKITIFDLKNEELFSPKDFETNEIDNKIALLLDKTKDSLVTFEEFEITKKGVYNAKNKNIPYIQFASKVKNMPFKNVIGVVACYSTKNEKSQIPSSKVVVTMTNANSFNYAIPRDFVQSIRF